MERTDQPFALLLKRYRRAVALSQEERAERTGLSARAIMYLEHGQRAPYPDTVRRLAEALALAPPERAAFVTAADSEKTARVVHPCAEPRLSCPPTPLLGRDREAAHLHALFGRTDVRLVTLTGLGGVGKTHLALHVAAQLASAFSDGVLLVTLADVREPAVLPATVAAALGIGERGTQPLWDRLVAVLRHRQVLLLLDNFEQLAPAAPFVSALLATCPRLRTLVTSRVRLGIRGEHEVAVVPLAVPDPSRLPATDILAQVPAVALFLYHARRSSRTSSSRPSMRPSWPPSVNGSRACPSRSSWRRPGRNCSRPAPSWAGSSAA